MSWTGICGENNAGRGREDDMSTKRNHLDISDEEFEERVAMAEGGMMRIDEVCQFLGLSRSSVYKLMDSGQLAWIRRIVSAKIAAPPSGSSSRFTEVTTAWRRFRAPTASATRCGSPSSSQVGRPVFTAQNPQLRVQTSPRIMNVAVR